MAHELGQRAAGPAPSEARDRAHTQHAVAFELRPAEELVDGGFVGELVVRLRVFVAVGVSVCGRSRAPRARPTFDTASSPIRPARCRRGWSAWRTPKAFGSSLRRCRPPRRARATRRSRRPRRKAQSPSVRHSATAPTRHRPSANLRAPAWVSARARGHPFLLGCCDPAHKIGTHASGPGFEHHNLALDRQEPH